MSDDKALAIIPRTLVEVQSLAEILSKSTLLPEALRGKVPDVVVSILAGAELGLAPMASIAGVHVISGKPVLAAATMMGLCLASGLAEYFAQIESTATSVTFETKRKGSPVPQRVVWTVEDAKRAGIYKNVWLTYPRQMLAARAKAELARAVYPDVCAGVYDPDEVSAPSTPVVLASVPSQPAEVIEDAEIVESKSIAAQCAEAADYQALSLLVPALNKLPKGSTERTAAMAAYKARSAELELAAQLTASVAAP